MAGFDNEVVWAENVDFSGGAAVSGKITDDGDLLIGSAVAPNIRVAKLTAGNGMTVTNAAGSISIILQTPVSVSDGGTGAASFTAGSVIFSDGSALTEDNSNLFYNDSDNRLGIGTTTPLDTLHIVGALELDHTSAESDDHALEIVCDAAGFGDVKAIDIDYITGAVAAGEDEEAIIVNIDETASTGGIVAGYLVLSTAEGSATINGYETGININPVVQESGSFSNATEILNKAVDVTAALNSGGAGAISIFVDDDDTFTVGHSATWDEFEIILATGASGGGVAPTFAYSTGGAGYTAFSPADGTNGFRNTGAILWDSSTLAGWATATSGRFEILITRTRNSLSTTPIIDELQISSTTEFKWDSSGDVNINSLTLVTDLAVAHGGTGASTLTGVVIGNGTGAMTATAPTEFAIVIGATSSDIADVGPLTNGQLVVGSTGVAPVAASLTAPAAGITITGGAGTVTFALADDLAAAEGLSGTGFITRTASDTWADTAITDNAFVLGDGSELPQMLGPGTDGQIPVALTSATPVLLDMAWIPVEGGFVYNLGFTLAAGTFTLQGKDATLSATNPAFALLRNKASAGEYKLYKIIADQNFIDDAGSSEIIGNLFGNTTGVAFAANRPFFVYLTANDDEDTLQAMLSPAPNLMLSPAAANIGAPDDAVADAQGDMWSFDNIDETLFNGNPCLNIGVIRMQMSASDDWTVQTFSEQDGVGQYQETTWFTYVRGHGGAAANTHVITNAGTEPTCASDQIRYRIDRHANVFVNMNFTVNNTPSGANTVLFAMPYDEHQTGVGLTRNFSDGFWLNATVRQMIGYAITLNTQQVGNIALDGGSTLLTNATFASADALRMNYSFRAFDTNA